MASSIDVFRHSRGGVLEAVRERRRSGRWPEGVIVALADAATVAGPVLAAYSLGYAVLCTAFIVMAVGAAGLYRPRLSLSVLDDLPRLVFACGFALALVFATIPWWGGGRHTGAEPTPVLVVVAMALVIGRAASYGGIRAARRARPGRAALVVGVDEPSALVVRTLLEQPEFGLEPVGCVAVAPNEGKAPLPLLGQVDDLAELVRDSGAQYLVIALSAAESSEADMVDVLRACGSLPCRAYLVPQLYELHPVSSAVEVVRGIPLVALRSGRPGRTGVAAKRLFDILLAGTALVLVSPLMLGCALAVRLEGGPGVMFQQTRIGRDGKPFTLLKFRSMKPATQAEADTAWSIADDERVGPVGRFLRKTSLDELPQLINILRGDMSLIGPRPERPHFVHEFEARYARNGYGHRHRMNTGLTGLAQVNGLRGDTSIGDRVLLDNHYIENWSFWLDVKIVLRTAAVMFKGDR